ncbi:SusC/RagA family TonB-linked outer membrane protein [Aestuariibaculum sediminum]|uniref:TonB-dependent receptor n=1 Tax=Aestuariibaculum sediminum TaxID=2770637 RepID=A0A8J6U8H0_9FLAO|nr:TonB-dependent receptor [Aestuariibaculum sediminum]MBD0831542.1 TonB-dependent receptor [Aestuariibaculum sediminum]
MIKLIKKRKVFFSCPEFDFKLKLVALFLCLTTAYQVQATEGKIVDFKNETQKRTITGVVKDASGVPLPGANVIIKGTTTGVTTNFDGEFTLDINSSAEILVVSYLGYESVEIEIGTKSVFNILLNEDAAALNEVVVVGFGTQKKTSLVSAITTIEPEEIKGPTSNLTTMMAGRVAGMIAFQQSGEPGQDNAEFFIRGLGNFGTGKRDPLILIDGVESTPTDMARLQPDDIDKFSVLKDASAASIYGARGANGVVLINTKRGIVGKMSVRFRTEQKVSTNSKNFKFADNITYMNLANEAALTRDPQAVLPYSKTKIDRTAAGYDPILYPNNDWIDQLIQDVTINNSYNISLSGGGEKARYYVASTYNIDNGVLKVDKINNFNNNIKLQNYSFRSNVDMNLTETTDLAVNLYAQFDDYTGPIGGGTNIFNRAIWSNPVKFPAVYPQELRPYVEHPLFGGAVTGQGSTTLLTNPYAEMVRGYSVRKAANVQAQIQLRQNLSDLLTGLSLRAMGYIRRISSYEINRSYNPFYYQANVNPDTNEINLSLINNGLQGSIGTPGREYLNYGEGAKDLNSRAWLETAINYNHTFGEKHDVSGMLIGIMSNYETANAGSLQLSLPYKNLGLSGRFTYGYDDRYLVEMNFGYNGSERFAKNNRFGFFPSFALGYIISNEKFFESLKPVVSNLKLRASYGWVGNDQIGAPNERFFYLPEVNLDNPTYGASFGELNNYYRPGISIIQYPNEQISWEKSKQINLGIDLSLFNNSLSIVADVFKQNRSDIYQRRTAIGSTLGLATTPATNFGKAESKGFDGSISYNKDFYNGWWTNLRGNFTYSTSEIIRQDEINYPEELSYRSVVGNSVAQTYGYIAERLFIDDQEAANSPTQFGEYGGGDIKYKDVNGDGVITELDLVPMGYPTVPEIIYGFGGSVGYKKFDFSVFFQGAARTSFFINPQNISPFVINGGAQNGLLKVVAEDHWSEDNRNSYAFWPRLSEYFVDNNNRTSTWWMRNGAFLRLKSIELGFNMPQNFLDKMKINSLRFYANSLNPVVFSQFKMWDPEMGGNGLGYPIQTTYNFGILLEL